MASDDSRLTIRNALVSVSDKTGLDALCRRLLEAGVKLYSTRGTGEFLRKGLGCDVSAIEDLTKFPELMEGRVKTLHPRLFGGILARREVPRDLDEANEHGIPLFDLVVVNLYPFAEHLGKSPKEQSAWIDIGGPSLLRAAAKNHRSVAVLCDPSQYESFTEELAREGGISLATRKRLAAAVFAKTSRYDALIASEWAEPNELPGTIPLSPRLPLRYGENPHQKAVWCRETEPTWRLLQGKELSYNNLLDAEAASGIVRDLADAAVAIVKHNNPCGVAAGARGTAELFDRAFAADSKSAFGGVVATNREVDDATAEKMAGPFLEVIVAPAFSPGARDRLKAKSNLRLIEWPSPSGAPFETRPALGGWLLQSSDTAPADRSRFGVVSRAPVPADAWDDLLFSWMVVKHVRSNAIVIAKSGVTLGIGAGQMSRVDAVAIALEKAREKGTAGGVLASDAFFPFRDNTDALRGSGIRAVIQPGGSKRDDEVIASCDEQGIALVFTGERHFRH